MGYRGDDDESERPPKSWRDHAAWSRGVLSCQIRVNFAAFKGARRAEDEESPKQFPLRPFVRKSGPSDLSGASSLGGLGEGEPVGT